MSSTDSTRTTVRSGTATPEDTLRALDQLGAPAVFEADAATLANLYAADRLLHFAPAGTVRTRQAVLDDVREKRTLFTSFTRVTEHASLHGDVGVTIGSEVAVANCSCGT